MENSLINSDKTIDSILNTHKDSLGTSYDFYRNHVYRIYNLAKSHFSAADSDILKIACAFHDIGIWTHKTFDYLEPSKDLSVEYCKNKAIDSESAKKIAEMITGHHKITKNRSSESAEIFRQADLSDLSFGFIGLKSGKDFRKELNRQFPNKGFHLALVKLFLKQVATHPMKPLPMFRL
ncbi:MAG: hypothetical protein K8R21_03915 [Leptospira sp.]|nr:hypothetical protein [Leptospira sp.]